MNYNEVYEELEKIKASLNKINSDMNVQSIERSGFLVLVTRMQIINRICENLGHILVAQADLALVKKDDE